MIQLGKRSAWPLAVFVLLALVPLGVTMAQSPAPGGQWIPYQSERFLFCAAYPNGWQVEELFDGAVLKAQPPGQHDRDPLITLGGYQGKKYEGHVKSLEEIAEDAEDDLRDQMVRQLKSENIKGTLQGKPSLTTVQSYLRGTVPWRAKEVRILRDDSVVVELALRANDEQFEKLLPEFDQMISSVLRLSCKDQPVTAPQRK